MPGIGAHPRGIHLWWARRPLAAARAVIFAQMVNDPGYQQGEGFKYGVNKEKAAIERERLFKIIEDLVKWENTNNKEVLSRARAEIWRSWRETCDLNKDHPQAAELFNPEKLPAFHDPFAGGGALPLEAQRLGLESYASDLNPVAVAINKAMIEIPPKFAGRSPVGPKLTEDKQAKLSEDWSGAKGLAEDVRRYGAWIRDEAEKRIGHLYPKVEITTDMVAERPDLKPYLGKKLTVIAWIWARTVKSPNPAFSHVDVPLVSNFILSSKVNREAYIEPVTNGDNYRFTVKMGTPPEGAHAGTTAGKRNGFYCLLSGSPMDYVYIREEGSAGRMGTKLMAIVAEGAKGRVYLTPTCEHETIANDAMPEWRPETPLHGKCRANVSNYGMDAYGDLFTSRQLVALNMFSDLLNEAVLKIKVDAVAAGMVDDSLGLEAGGVSASAYAQAVSTYLAFVIDRCADFSNTATRWVAGNEKVMNLFGKQAIAMTWDFPEAAILNNTVGGFLPAAEFVSDCINKLVIDPLEGHVEQRDAQTQKISENKVVSTDPPYYDNIGYADLSDFFYVWLRRNLRYIYPNLFATMAAPKDEELVATPYRHGTKDRAEAFFLEGMTTAMHKLAEQVHPTFPVTIYYAFKQSETSDLEGTSSSGWETFLEAVLQAGLVITGTWPMRSEQAERLIGKSANALASSIVLVCRKRSSDAPTISRRDFLRELNNVLPQALLDMTRGGDNSPVAPVDLSQAIIGPGMAIFSQYAAVLEADGKPMSVRTALQLINRFFAEDDFDHDTQFCLYWFDSVGWASGKFGDADVLARAKGTSVGGLVEAGVVESSGGNLRLLRWAELPKDWSPETDNRLPIWEALHHLIRALNQDGESAAGSLLARIPSRAESMRALAYRLYTLCERKGWAEEARGYNELVAAWSGIELAAQDAGIVGYQGRLDI
jgi:putative DNA methylase